MLRSGRSAAWLPVLSTFSLVICLSIRFVLFRPSPWRCSFVLFLLCLLECPFICDGLLDCSLSFLVLSVAYLLAPLADALRRRSA